MFATIMKRWQIQSFRNFYNGTDVTAFLICLSASANHFKTSNEPNSNEHIILSKFSVFLIFLVFDFWTVGISPDFVPL